MNPSFTINSSVIAPNHPTYLVAEMSANHRQDFDQAVRILEAAKISGANAVKLQTYTPDTLTINSDKENFQIKGKLWDGRTLYDLYQEAYTPWEWQPKLKKIADDLELDLFSTPFDDTAVDFLEQMHVPCYKVASFEIVDLQLLRKVAGTGKPIIMSTGMATLAEIEEAVATVRDAGCRQLALLKCVSAYPAAVEETNLRTIPHLKETFHVTVGLSDHTRTLAVPVAAVALGASIIEKHFTLSRSLGGPDSAFSLEPSEFKAMVDAVRDAEKALGAVHYGPTGNETESLAFRRSLFVVRDVKAGDIFTTHNVRSIRPSHGLPPKFLQTVIGRRAAVNIEKGTPLSWSLIA